MSEIEYGDQKVSIAAGQTVLDALLQQGFDIPHRCRAGVCQSCLMQALEGEIAEEAQTGLKETQKSQGYFLACSCRPAGPLKIAPLQGEACVTHARVLAHELLSEDVLRLRLRPLSPFEYRAGQFTTILNGQKVGRSYSLASVPGVDDYLELHVRRIDGGQLSPWLHDGVVTGDQLQLQHACGDCFYTAESRRQPMLLAGTGTGLAPLIGIVRDAIKHDHQGEIHLLHGALRRSGLYLHETLRTLSAEHENVHYHASVLELKQKANGVSDDPLEKQALKLLSDAAQWKVYLCGAPEMVNRMKKQVFLAGTSMANIYTDPYLPSSEGANVV